MKDLYGARQNLKSNGMKTKTMKPLIRMKLWFRVIQCEFLCFFIKQMARVFIREKSNGFYVMTYRGVVAGPFATYAQARSSTGPVVN
jgi:hypothetical protein